MVEPYELYPLRPDGPLAPLVGMLGFAAWVLAVLALTLLALYLFDEYETGRVPSVLWGVVPMVVSIVLFAFGIVMVALW